MLKLFNKDIYCFETFKRKNCIYCGHKANRTRTYLGDKSDETTHWCIKCNVKNIYQKQRFIKNKYKLIQTIITNENNTIVKICYKTYQEKRVNVYLNKEQVGFRPLASFKTNEEITLDDIKNYGNEAVRLNILK